MLRLLPALSGLLLLAACVTPMRFEAEGHQRLVTRASDAGVEVPPVRMAAGETRLLVTPGHGPGPEGFPMSAYPEDPAIAVRQPVGSDFAGGTRITALAPGKTRVFYASAAYGADGRITEFEWSLIRNGNWFWLEVESG